MGKGGRGKGEGLVAEERLGLWEGKVALTPPECPFSGTVVSPADQPSGL